MPVTLQMRKAIIAALVAVAGLAAMLTPAGAAPASPEDRYIAARDAAIEKLSPIYDAGKFDDAATAAEDAARADLGAQMAAILSERRRAGFGAPTINLGSFYRGDEGFGTLDGLRFDAELGTSGEKAGRDGADGKYVEPRAHIIVTTQTLFGRWLRDHKEWWGKGIKNVPQRIGDALRDESFYTQTISSGSAVINFNALPIAKPASATFAYAMLAGQTQSEIPDAADEVFVSALADGKVYIAMAQLSRKCKSRPALQSGLVTTRGPRMGTKTFGSKKSTRKHTTSLATSANRAKTRISAVSPSALRGSRRSLKPQSRHRRCWRPLWEGRLKVPQFAFPLNGMLERRR